MNSKNLNCCRCDYISYESSSIYVLIINSKFHYPPLFRIWNYCPNFQNAKISFQARSPTESAGKFIPELRYLLRSHHTLDEVHQIGTLLLPKLQPRIWLRISLFWYKPLQSFRLARKVWWLQWSSNFPEGESTFQGGGLDKRQNSLELARRKRKRMRVAIP